jgi:homoserine kinase type II
MRDQVMSLWALSPTITVSSLATGMNNASFLVTSGTGSFVLKSIQNTGMLERVRFEHSLLETLSQRGLPYDVPAPVRTRAGETVASLEDGSPAVLTRRLPGGPAWRGDSMIARMCGRALAQLDAALASIELDPEVQVPTVIEALGRLHPAIPVPAAATRAALVEPDLAANVTGVLERAEREWKRQTMGVPEQIIDGDFFPPNVLVEGGQVTAVLDFEFSGTGQRAMDLAVGLVAFGTANRNELPTWELFDVFAAGYLEVLSLSRQEIACLPALILMREAGSFVHWLGRMTEGLTTLDDVRARADRLLALDDWLQRSGPQMVDRLLWASNE